MEDAVPYKSYDFGRYAPAFLVMHPAPFTLGRPVFFSTGTSCSVGQCNLSTAELALDTLRELPLALSRQQHNMVELSPRADGTVDERLGELNAFDLNSAGGARAYFAGTGGTLYTAADGDGGDDAGGEGKDAPTATDLPRTIAVRAISTLYAVADFLAEELASERVQGALEAMQRSGTLPLWLADDLGVAEGKDDDDVAQGVFFELQLGDDGAARQALSAVEAALCRVAGVGGGELALHLTYFEGSVYATLSSAADEQPLLDIEPQDVSQRGSCCRLCSYTQNSQWGAMRGAQELGVGNGALIMWERSADTGDDATAAFFSGASPNDGVDADVDAHVDADVDASAERRNVLCSAREMLERRRREVLAAAADGVYDDELSDEGGEASGGTAVGVSADGGKTGGGAARVGSDAEAEDEARSARIRPSGWAASMRDAEEKPSCGESNVGDEGGDEEEGARIGGDEDFPALGSSTNPCFRKTAQSKKKSSSETSSLPVFKPILHVDIRGPAQLRGMYGQTYCVLKPHGAGSDTARRETLFRFGNWCYRGFTERTEQMALAQAMGQFGTAVAALQRQQSGLAYVGEAAQVPTSSPFAMPMKAFMDLVPAVLGQFELVEALLASWIEQRDKGRRPRNGDWRGPAAGAAARSDASVGADHSSGGGVESGIGSCGTPPESMGEGKGPGGAPLDRALAWLESASGRSAPIFEFVCAPPRPLPGGAAKATAAKGGPFGLMSEWHDVFAPVEMLATKVYLADVVLLFMYTPGAGTRSFHATLLDCQLDAHPLLDTYFPDLGRKAFGYQLRTYPVGLGDEWPQLRKLTLWQVQPPAPPPSRKIDVAGSGRSGDNSDKADDSVDTATAGLREEVVDDQTHSEAKAAAAAQHLAKAEAKAAIRAKAQAKAQAKGQLLQNTGQAKAEAKSNEVALQAQAKAQVKAQAKVQAGVGAKAQAKAHVMARAFVEQGVKQAQGQPAVLFAAQAETQSQARAQSLTRAQGMLGGGGAGSVALPHHLPPMQRLQSGPSGGILGAKPLLGATRAEDGCEHTGQPGSSRSGIASGANARSAAPWDASGAPRHRPGTPVTWSAFGV